MLAPRIQDRQSFASDLPSKYAGRKAQKDFVAGPRDEEMCNEQYAMRRANGDWFALDDHGRLRRPVLRSRSEAMRARARNSEMLRFKRVDSTSALSMTRHPAKTEGAACFWPVSNPPINLSRGSPSRARAACLAQTRGRGTAVR